MTRWLSRPAALLPAEELSLQALAQVVKALPEGLLVVRAIDGMVMALNTRAEQLSGQAAGHPLNTLQVQSRRIDLLDGACPGYYLLRLEEPQSPNAMPAADSMQIAAMGLLQAVTVVANEASCVEDVAQFALERLCQYSGWPVGHAYLLEAQTRQLKPMGRWSLKDPAQCQAFQAATATTCLQPGEDLPGAVLLSGQPEYWAPLSDRADYARREPAQRCGLRIGCAMPILTAGQVTGVLELYSDDAAATPEALLAIAGPLGILLGRVYERVELQREQARKAQMLSRNETAILNILSDLRQSHDALQAAQLQLIQAAKLESVGRLAAGVAHEVKNPLAIILMGTAYLGKQPALRDNEKLADVLKDIRDAVIRADGVIKGLLEFSASRGLALAPHDPVAMIRQALSLVKHEFVKANVASFVELEDHLPLIPMDRMKLEQVLVNLFVNAVHAMPHGGKITVRAHRQKLTEAGSGVGQRQTDCFRVGQTVLAIEVDDTGTGIPADKLGKVFDPFFTTKAPGQGTGLGLSVTRNIVELHRGTIGIANRPEGGVRATLLLPLEESPNDA